jgi:hypothetical protein
MSLINQLGRATGEKQAGYYTELAGGLNPFNMLGGTALGALAALLTPTRSLLEQAHHDKDSFSNLLLPGKGPYNMAKRVGTSIRGPEFEKILAGVRAKESSVKAAGAGASSFTPLAGGFIDGAMNPMPGRSGFSTSIFEGGNGLVGGVGGGIGGGVLAAILALLAKAKGGGIGAAGALGGLAGSSLGTAAGSDAWRQNQKLTAESMASLFGGKK